MSVEAMAWALRAPFGGTKKILLVGLANHATAEFDHARPAVATLAGYAAIDERNVRKNLRTLEAEGWIERTGEFPVQGRRDRAVYVYRLVRERGDADVRASSDGGTLASGRGDAGEPNGGTLASGEPSKNRKREPSKKAGAQQEVLDGSDPVLERALSWLEDEIEKQVGIRPRRTTAQRRAVAKILGRFPTGQAREPMARALAFAYADRYWSTRITKPSEFEAAFARLLSGANTSARIPARPGGEDREVPSFKRGMEIAR